MLIRFMVDAFYGKYLRRGETAEVEDGAAKALVAKGKAVAVEAAQAEPEPEQTADAAAPEPAKKRPRKKPVEETGI